MGQLNLLNIVAVLLCLSLSRQLYLPLDSQPDSMDYGADVPKPLPTQYFFREDGSYVEVSTGVWKTEEDFELRLDVRTRSFSGQLASIVITRLDSAVKLFEITLGIEHRALAGKFEFITNEGPALLGNIVFDKEISDGNLHLITMRFNNRLFFLEQDSADRSTSLATNIPETELKTTLYLGSTGVNYPSFIGCMEGLVAFANYHPTNLEVLLKEAVDDVCPLKHECAKQMCKNGADCINAGQSDICDCFSTGFEAPHCAGESNTIGFKNAEHFLQYTVSLDEDMDIITHRRQPDRIALRFKTRASTTQALFETTLESVYSDEYEGTLRVLQSPDAIEVTLGGIKPLKIPVRHGSLNENRWHSLEIRPKYNEQSATVVLDAGVSHVINWEELPLVQLAGSAYFGGKELDSDEKAKGFLGCMKDIYIGYESLLFSLARDTRAGIAVGPDGIYMEEFTCPEFAALEDEQPVEEAEQEVEPEQAVENEETEAELVMEEEDVVPEEQEVALVAPEEQEVALEEQPEVAEEEQVVAEDDPGVYDEEPVIIDEATAEPLALEPDEAIAEEELIPEEEEEEEAPAAENIVDDLETDDDETVAEDIKAENDAMDLAKQRLFQNVITCQTLDCPGDCNLNPETGFAECDCGDTGKAGKRCQFSTLPKSCNELFVLGEKRSGIYKIDVDGSGQLPPKLVHCIMDSEAGVGMTTVDNNIPNDTLIRSADTGRDSVYKVHYRILTDDHMIALASVSSRCQQFVKYQCSKAPLAFNEKTWFTSVGHKKRFGKIGDTSGQCSEATCNCDENQHSPTSDEGYVTGKFAGIKSVTVLQSPNTEWAKLSLGGFQCTGSAGSQGTVTISDPSSSITISKAWTGKQFSIWMRTSATQATLVDINSENGESVSIRLRDAHIVEAEFRTDSDSSESPPVVRVAHTTKLTDSRWHRVKLEIADNEAWLTVDTQGAFASVGALGSVTWQDLVIGGSDESDGDGEGFVGCLRALIVDDTPMDIQAFVTGQDSGIMLGCVEHCAASPCQNNAECKENYRVGSYECVCKNPWTHSGPHCEHDLNAQGEISLHDPKASYLKFTNLPESPVSDQIVLSFRTDKHKSLILYSHDHLYNFVEVALVSQHTIRLITNYGTEIKQCTIVREKQEFSDMEWNQLVIKYDTAYTALMVDELECIIDGGRSLSEVYIQDFTSGKEYETIIPPRVPYRADDSTSSPYTILFLGGLPRPKLGQRYRRATEKSYYFTTLHHFQGCFRGLKVGPEPVSLQDTQYFSPDASVKTGCDTGCDSLTCENGGHCKVIWEDDNQASCDCSLTSYSGIQCNEERGIQFPGTAVLSFDAEHAPKDVLHPRKGVSWISFAFSTFHRSERSQLLALVAFKDNTQLEIYVDPEGYLDIKFDDPEMGNHGQRFTGDFLNDKRHFVHIEFHPGRYTMDIVVDSIHKHLKTNRKPVDIRFATQIAVGGSSGDLQARTVEFDNYQGCMSNLLVKIGTARYEPMRAYLNGEADRNNRLVKIIGNQEDIIEGHCAKFAIPPVPVHPEPAALHFPEWHQSVDVVPYEKPHTGGTGGTDAGSHATGDGDDDTNGDGGGGGGGMHPAKIVAIIFGIIFMICLILGIFYMIYLRYRKDKPVYTTEEDAFPPKNSRLGGDFARESAPHETAPLQGSPGFHDPKPYSPTATPYTPGTQPILPEREDRPELEYQPHLHSPAPTTATNNNDLINLNGDLGPISAQSEPSIYQPPPGSFTDTSKPFSRPLSHFVDEGKRVAPGVYPPADPLPEVPLSPHEFT